MKLQNHPVLKKALAHRGLHDAVFDENSMLAFAAAVDAGYGIELDVHMTLDKKIIVTHDYSLKRVTGCDLSVTKHAYDEIKKCLLFKTKTPTPLLSDVLKIVRGRVPILVELKAENNYDPTFVSVLLQVLEPYEYKETIALQSFNPYIVKELRMKQSQMIVGQLISFDLPDQSRLVQFVFKSLYVLKISKPNFINCDVELIKKRRIQRVRKKMPLIAWTIDTPAKLEITRKYADNIIFEHIKP